MTPLKSGFIFENHYLKFYKNFKYNFQQDFEHDILNVKDTLIEYSKQGKLHFLNLIDILNITDYNEIQEFKKNFIQ